VKRIEEEKKKKERRKEISQTTIKCSAPLISTVVLTQKWKRPCKSNSTQEQPYMEFIVVYLYDKVTS
jgi:hypothetical protein